MSCLHHVGRSVLTDCTPGSVCGEIWTGNKVPVKNTEKYCDPGKSGQKKDPGGKKGRETHRDQEGHISLISAFNITSFSQMSRGICKKNQKKVNFAKTDCNFASILLFYSMRGNCKSPQSSESLSLRLAKGAFSPLIANSIFIFF